MVETNVLEASRRLEAIIRENLQTVCGKKVYRGHAAEYTPAVWAVRRAVQRGQLGPKDLLRRKAHWHPEFSIDLADNIEQHNYLFALNIFRRLCQHTLDGRPVIWITPVGPMGHYPIIAELFNRLGRLGGSLALPRRSRKRLACGRRATSGPLVATGRLGGSLALPDPKLVYTFAMDEWASRDGAPVDRKEFPYMTSFKEDMEQQFYGRFAPAMRIPEGNRHFAAGKGLHQYEADIDKLLAQGAGVIFTGGVGKIGHIMFWESTFGVRLGKALAEKVLFVRGAPLTYGTIDQNETTSSGSAPVPAFANTIGLGLFVKLRKYGEKRPGRVHAYFGLDNDEEPLKWQRFIAQCMLAMEAADPSFGASYVPTLPGAYIIVRSHVEKTFFVPSK